MYLPALPLLSLLLSQVRAGEVQREAEKLPELSQEQDSSTNTPTSNSIWSEPVKCIPEETSTDPYCVYSDATFANGRGISLFTTPETAEVIAALPAFTKKGIHKNVNKLDNPPWEVKHVEGRGRGLFATKVLHRGDKILSTTPVGIYHSGALGPDSKLDYIYLHTAFIQLPQTSQDLFLNTNAAEGDPIMDRVSMNAFAAEFEGKSHYFMYPETALLNHDCRPNTMYDHDPKKLVHTTIAARTIEIGEELTVPYINVMQTRTERQKVLDKFWGFKCSCSFCSAPPETVLASDQRLAKIISHQTALANYNPWSTGTPLMAEELITLYEEEKLYAAKAAGHTLAALAYNAVGDTKLAEWHADFALEAGVVSTGPDDDKKQMKLLLEDPKAHWSYKVRAPKDEL